MNEQMVSVLVVTYNSAQYIQDCLLSFAGSTTPLELIVVDNHSKDTTVEIVNRLGKEYPQLGIKLVCNASNEGFAKGMNLGFRLASGGYVMTFNPDARVFGDTLEKAVAFMKVHPTVGKIGLADLDENGIARLPLHAFSRYNTPQFVKRFYHPVLPHQEQTSEPFEVDWLFGTGFLIRRAAVQDNSLYAESSFLFWEEYWLSKKIKGNGYKIYITPDIRIQHHGGTTFKFDKQKMFYARWLSMANEWIVRKDHYGSLNASVNNALYLLDNAFLYSTVYVKGLFSKPDQERLYSLFDYRGKLLSAWRILWWPKKQLSEVNTIAKKFFNS